MLPLVLHSANVPLVPALGEGFTVMFKVLCADPHGPVPGTV